MNEGEKFTGYVTKWGLTDGIIQATLTVVNDIIVRVDLGKSWSVYARREGVEWHRTLAEAEKRVDEMRLKKMTSLMKQYNRLDNYRPILVVKYGPP